MMNLASTKASYPLDGELFMGMGEALSQKNLKWEPPTQLGQLENSSQEKDGDFIAISVACCVAYMVCDSQSLAFVA